MTPFELKAVQALALCSFLPGSFEKRIARQWKEKADRDPKEPMTERGRACLWRLIWKFRRQISDKKLIDHAGNLREQSQ